MRSSRRVSITVGVLFIVATISALLAAFVDKILAGPSFLVNAASSANRVIIGVVFYVLAAMTSASIPIAMYPLIKQRHPALALGSVIFRAIEAAFYLIAVLSLLSLVATGKKITALTENEQSAYYVIGDFLLKLREHATLLGVVSFCIGSLSYFYIFIRTRLIPFWLSAWGIIASILMSVACALSLFSDSPITGYTALVIPIALQEMVFAVWLLIKGFREQTAA